jgi:phage terminase large subunit-like protein
MSLKQLALHAQNLQKLALAEPLKFWRPTPVQKRYLSDPSKLKLLRGANQIGKSVTGAVETIHYCLGTHPYLKTPPPPVECWVICHSWEQSRILQKKIFDLIPPAALHPDVEFNLGKGFRGTGAPVVKFANGSIMRIKTTNQGTLGLASGTVTGFIWCDEPPPKNIIGELLGRLVRTKGKMGITMTPIGIPCDHIKKLVDEGKLSDHPAPLTIENVTPIGCKSLLTQAEIDDITLAYLPIDRAARISGSWESGIPDGRIFEHFSDEMITDQASIQTNSWIFAIGIDHGSQMNSEVAILVAVDVTEVKKGRGSPFVYVLDEYTAGAADAEIHARGIINMVKRNKLALKDIRYWIGDRSHGGDKYGGRMSNNMLTAAFCHVLGYPRGRLPFAIRMAHKPAYSVYYGCQALHQLQSKHRFEIHPKCKRTIKSLKFWAITRSGRMDVMSEWKHLIDALRYATMPIIDQQYRAPKMAKFSLR